MRTGLEIGHVRQKARAEARRSVPCHLCQRPLRDGLSEHQYSVTTAYRLVSAGYCSTECLREGRRKQTVLPDGPLVTPTDQGIRCNICGQTFKHLSSHMKMKHGLSGDRTTGKLERAALYQLTQGIRCASNEYREEARWTPKKPGKVITKETATAMHHAGVELRSHYMVACSEAQIMASRKNWQNPDLKRWNAYQQAMQRKTVLCLWCGAHVVTTYGREKANRHERWYCSRKCAAIVNNDPLKKAEVMKKLERLKIYANPASE